MRKMSDVATRIWADICLEDARRNPELAHPVFVAMVAGETMNHSSTISIADNIRFVTILEEK